IRDLIVTGVQTCALPIFVATAGSGSPVVAIMAEYDALPGLSQKPGEAKKDPEKEGAPGHGCGHNLLGTAAVAAAVAANHARIDQIGRASCRERVHLCVDE